MKARKHTVLIRMNDEELEHLNQMAGASIYNREKFLRLLLKGYTMCKGSYNTPSQALPNDISALNHSELRKQSKARTTITI